MAYSSQWISFPLCIKWKRKRQSIKTRDKKSESWLFGISLPPLWFHNFEVKTVVSHVQGLWKLPALAEKNSCDSETKENRSSQELTNFTAVLWHVGTEADTVWQASDWPGPSHYPWWGSLETGRHPFRLSSRSAKGIQGLIISYYKSLD